MPTLSVIIPTFNRASMVRMAVQSVLNQTYPDFEIIVVDDGSTDNTREALSDLSDKIVYMHQPNRGRSSARNRAISLAKGSYIAFLDSDDLFLPAKLKKQLKAMEKRPDIMLSHTSYQHIDAEGKYIKDIKAGRFTGKVYPQITWRCPIATPTVMVRKEALGEGNVFDENMSAGEDVILWTRIARRSEVLGIDEPLTQVRIREDNAASSPQAQITSLRYILNNVVKKDPDIPAVTRFALSTLIRLIIGCHRLRRIINIQPHL